MTVVLTLIFLNSLHLYSLPCSDAALDICNIRLVAEVTCLEATFFPLQKVQATVTLSGKTWELHSGHLRKHMT